MLRICSSLKPRRLRPSAVDRVRQRRVARDHDVRRDVARQDRAAAEKGVRADLGELVHGGEPAEDHPVADLDVAAERRAVGEHGLVADLSSRARRARTP